MNRSVRIAALAVALGSSVAGIYLTHVYLKRGSSSKEPGKQLAERHEAQDVPGLANRHEPEAQPAHSTEALLQDVSISTEFDVKDGNVTAIRGEKETCQVDNEFIRAALKTQNIEFKNCSYHVSIKQGKVEVSDNPQSRPLKINIFAIDDLKCQQDELVAQLLDALAKSDYRKARVSTYEFPVTAYLLNVKDRLTLVSHYGLSSYYPNIDMASLINQVKQGKFF